MDLISRSFDLDVEAEPWSEQELTDVGLALVGLGYALSSELVVERPVMLTSPTARHNLLLRPNGTWQVVTLDEVLCEDRYTPRIEGVTALQDLLRALLALTQPYFACAWPETNGYAPWIQTVHPFRASIGHSFTWLGPSYLAHHNDGKPYPRCPFDNEVIGGGQLILGPPVVFGPTFEDAALDKVGQPAEEHAHRVADRRAGLVLRADG